MVINYLDVFSRLSTKIWKNIASKREIYMFAKLDEWFDIQYGEGEVFDE